jgi:hypothetical protein
MVGIPAKFGTVALLAVTTAIISPGIVRAAGPFDGNWVLSAAGAGGRQGELGGDTACSDFRIPFRINDNQIAGTYSRSTSNPTEVVASPTGTPMTGSVQPDGTFTMRWEAYNLSGKIAGNTMTATWRGQCGERSATGTRVQ